MKARTRAPIVAALRMDTTGPWPARDALVSLLLRVQSIAIAKRPTRGSAADGALALKISALLSASQIGASGRYFCAAESCP